RKRKRARANAGKDQQQVVELALLCLQRYARLQHADNLPILILVMYRNGIEAVGAIVMTNCHKGAVLPSREHRARSRNVWQSNRLDVVWRGDDMPLCVEDRIEDVGAGRLVLL